MSEEAPSKSRVALYVVLTIIVVVLVVAFVLVGAVAVMGHQIHSSYDSVVEKLP